MESSSCSNALRYVFEIMYLAKVNMKLIDISGASALSSALHLDLRVIARKVLETFCNSHVHTFVL